MYVWMYGWMDGWMDVCMYVCMCVCVYIYNYIYNVGNPKNVKIIQKINLPFGDGLSHPSLRI